ncbi:hypothetical protein BKG91_11410 [Rodentibacter caecimuris]|uniref:Uncharacterized protein n=1 Tax=Rodentibacter caecimuris TaxID=1796644 RepID=A0AAJ3K4Y8_9PAST|nr:hypothetical protein [Rodentibacter heylii]AOF54472.1 hypothetical protein AC062_2386 [Pasteurellaceae bacterium NI1060]MCQ9123160.1 hypothetical protein [Rodentibacter heylii]OOF71694.1 hypothetical protein BKG91_11410 [Rodentibacter heylii]OOF71708.1 hypothetical protein BKG90_07450 [Rodentibacter heylii]OOF73208.1 hypothetical protein BKG99_11620 [Rodentibacter heylii]
MNIKFTFKLEADSNCQGEYVLEYEATKPWTIDGANEKAAEIIRLLELHRLEQKPMIKPIPLIKVEHRHHLD